MLECHFDPRMKVRVEMSLGRCLLACVALVEIALLPTFATGEQPYAAPANAGICEVLSDATPGLAPLCVGYCERRDCLHLDSVACSRLLSNYDRKRRDDDPEMPCLQTCPCFTAEELREHPVELTACSQAVSAESEFSGLFDQQTSTQGVGVFSSFERDFYQCRYVNGDAAPPDFRFEFISPEDADICHAIVGREIFDRGLDCGAS
jgi:hypothetical protein